MSVLEGLSTPEEVRAAIVQGRVAGMCGAAAPDAPAWTLCAVLVDDAAVIAAAHGPAGADAVVVGREDLSTPLAQPGDEVVAIHGLHGGLALEVVDAQGDVIGSVGVAPR